jgi:mannose-6-phosphate isomerase-like protein (cupin superfamily)
MSTPTVVRAGRGRGVGWGPAGTIRILAGADSTDGSFSLVEAIEEPGSAAPLHVHHGEAEAFYVVEGTIELTCGEHTLTAGPGDFVYTPKDVPHRYAVVGERPARLLLLFSRPGFEQFFAEAGAPLDEPPAGPPDPERMKRLIDKYDLELLEPFGH